MVQVYTLILPHTYVPALLDPSRIVGWMPGHFHSVGQRQYWRPVLDTGAIADVHVEERGRDEVIAAQKATTEPAACPRCDGEPEVETDY